MPHVFQEKVRLPHIEPCDVLLVLPPFAGIDRPSLGLHVLQACARAAGFKVSILYANLLLAAELGSELYEAICYAPTAALLGERIFSPSAGFKVKADKGFASTPYRTASTRNPLNGYDITIDELALYAGGWRDRLVKELCNIDCAMIGLNSTFEQTASAVSIICGIKRNRAEIVTLLGGANCEGEMAFGISELSQDVDHIFSGESEVSFVEFLKRKLESQEELPRVVVGKPCDRLDEIPIVDYSEFYLQLTRCQEAGWIPYSKHIWLPYEGSRGCWWGQKHHCTFCGINGQGMGFREKSADKVVAELYCLLESHPSEKVLMVDNIMPSSFFTTLLPQLADLDRPLHIFYEQKSNLTLKKVSALRNAGIAVIQPGIEALSSRLLARMKKGVKAHQNIALLRYARACDLSVNWNLLYAFPGDEEENYEETIKIIKKITHLHPPTGVCHLSIDRFSPYFDRPEDFGISNVRPMESYAAVFPDQSNCHRLAYHFVGDYDCAHRRKPELIEEIESLVQQWRDSWMLQEVAQPSLAIEQIDGSQFLLADTRSQRKLSFVSFEQAQVALTVMRAEDISKPLLRWAVDEAEVSLQLDGFLVPLATARPALLSRFESGFKVDVHEGVIGQVSDVKKFEAPTALVL
jgi:ribosomal peptide maturation radical SAM protein 1